MTEVRIPVRDGVELAATLYLPDPAAGPQPCLLEALPYRKDDVIGRRTTAHTSSVSEYDTPHDGTAREEYVWVDRRTWDQGSHAVTTYDPTWPGISVQVTSTMDVAITAPGLDVTIETVAALNGEHVSTRTWSEHVPRSV